MKILDELVTPEAESILKLHEAKLREYLLTNSVYVMIIPQAIGRKTEQWITIGNILTSTTIVSSLVSIASSVAWPWRPYLYVPLTLVAMYATVTYSIRCSRNPCANYQVVKDPKIIELAKSFKSAESFVLLEHIPNTLASTLQFTFTAASIVGCFYVAFKYT